MNVFELLDRLVSDYAKYVGSFIQIKDDRIHAKVDAEIARGLLWPDPLIQLNPSYAPGASIDELVERAIIHQECARIFRKDKDSDPNGRPLRLYKHQEEAILIAVEGHNYVLTTGTGSGKSLAYIIPIVNHVLRSGSGRGVQAIIVYPMNALANSQLGELDKFLCQGYPDGKGPVTFARYTGQEADERKKEIISNPPDILLTNYVMLELILTRRSEEQQLIRGASQLRFLVLDELHTYRGRQGADVAMLVRRTRDACPAKNLRCVGTSATLAGTGTSYDEQREEVAQVASVFFGARVEPEHVVGETLRRTTEERDPGDPMFVDDLRKRIQAPGNVPPRDYERFVKDPLSSWLESSVGLTKEHGSDRLVRAKPRSISGSDGAAKELSTVAGVPEEQCAEAIRQQLLASYQCEPDPETGFPVFAFRLHQFIGRGDTVYASAEPEDSRYLTVRPQQFVPGDSERSRLLLPLAFCRECGQEYYCVRLGAKGAGGQRRFSPRQLSDQQPDEESEAGFLYVNSSRPWPTEAEEVLTRLPDDWLEEKRGIQTVRRDRRDNLPAAVRVGTDGRESDDGIDCHYIRAPFRFCLSCGVSYGFRIRSDFEKLSSLSTEGRSSATTILALAAIRHLRKEETLHQRARKLLSFTDNRQDASLQAGHFNDFIEIGILRSALYKAVADAGSRGLRYDEIVQRVFDSLDLPLEMYAVDPDVRFQALAETKRALHSVLGYRLYRDLKRGWRITAPNLEQCGLLEIKYLSLDELCEATDVWHGLHPALADSTPSTRAAAARTLLDFMRRELALKVDYLNEFTQQQIEQRSSQRLKEPWALDENEFGKMEHAAVLYPRSVRPGDYRGHVYLSARGGFGMFLRRPATFPDYPGKLTLEETQLVCRQLLDALKSAGLVEAIAAPKDEDDVPGYQVPASCLLWLVGDGTRSFHDPIRIPAAPEEGRRVNPFFVDFYRDIAVEGKGLEAREHTGQTQYEPRIEREQRFREGRLPILFCSPTMELGVDIAELNVVNMRNVPPTPANYAQRSGRAGRSGQPALVFTYCSTFRSHDQYFFRRPELMVAGAVAPPRLDMANEDLVRAHVQAIWLAETGLYLGSSLVEVLDVEGGDPGLDLKDRVRDEINKDGPPRRALERAAPVLDSIREELVGSDWYSDGWLEEVIAQTGPQFDRACDRWRSLFRAAAAQRDLQHRIIGDASRTADEKNKARRLRAEAESQLHLLTEAKSVAEGDFYSYRYFATEGFLPGYNFPRLPLSAYIPGRRRKKGRDEFLSRPRFLAISEFGPRAIVYHEGSRYRINKVILPVGDREEDEGAVVSSAKQCLACGYLHPISEGDGQDLCEWCNYSLGAPLRDLFRLQNVSTQRTDKINSDEEERVRIGYEIRTGVRFAERAGRVSCRSATVEADGKELAKLAYGSAATLWRINLGWRRRKEKQLHGFVLDLERGYWARNEQDVEDDTDDPLSAKKKRVVPYVEDRKNCILLRPANPLSPAAMASLQAAMKIAIQVLYELEDSELAAEPLPSPDDRRLIMFYEAAEGGAGVLRRLVDDSRALARVAREALEICHFDPDTAEDKRRAPQALEDCAAACYDCLMSYSNQRDHPLLDRLAIRDFLMQLAQSVVQASPTELPRAEHLARLMRLCQSNLEREWLHFLEDRELRLPSKAQTLIEKCKTRPDFLYEDSLAAIYVDGPHHDYPDRQDRDEAQTSCMEDQGYIVIRFRLQDDWEEIIRKYPSVFGKIE